MENSVSLHAKRAVVQILDRVPPHTPIEQIAIMSGLSKRHLHRVLSSLVDNEIIERSDGRRFKAYTYTVDLDRAQEILQWV